MNLDIRTIRTIGAAATLWFAGACGFPSPPHVTEKDLTGRWSSSTCHTVLTVDVDHTFSVKNFPTEYSAQSDAVTGKLSGQGRWYLFNDTKDVYSHTLDLKHDQMIYSLDFAQQQNRLVLEWTVGDPDDGFTCRFSQTA
ncbi:hypothetical protein [Streptomyces sp. NBC_00687]|uniref:hypothetical protein n=1 Tax=Streptomyces sp. NBC_00687 TaxID=2975807 RepID=UPI002251934D|nr:hypothetical protein [Streptomyces sp. NBC_00687]MCX4918783.1 hypothetical protein [Streptomyces sp. NBC_00687]